MLNSGFSLRQKMALGILTLVVVCAGFELGAHSVKPKSGQSRSGKLPQTELGGTRRSDAEKDRTDSKNIDIQNVAYAPFTQLYEIFRSASTSELLNWAADLNKMPTEPKRSAAVTSFYKILVRVNPDAAMAAVSQIQDARIRDLAIGGLEQGAPQSVLPKIAEMLLRIPHRTGKALSIGLISKWSSIDPAAAGKFLNQHRNEAAGNFLFYDVLYNWGAINPNAAVAWLSENPSRRDKDTIRGLLQGWEEIDRAGAINYAIANASNAVFESGRNELAYTLLRKAPDEARAMILRLPVEQARATVKSIAELTTAMLIDAPEDYQRPPDVVAKWIVTLAPNLWERNLGAVIDAWDRSDPATTRAWLNQLSSPVRDFAVAAFCRSIVGERASPELIIQIGMTVNDRTLRGQALGEFVRGLGETRNEALQKLNALPLSPEEKRYLEGVMPASRHEEQTY